MRAVFGETSVVLIQGDITDQHVDAVVNAANERLAGGGGVDGAIHRAGGPSIMAECDALRSRQGGCPTGDAVATTAGRLSSRYVIHAVGPIWGQQSETESDRLLAGAYQNSLQRAAENDCRSVAFPSISTGAYGFPLSRAARVALSAVRQFVENRPFEEVRFVLFSENDLEVYQEALRSLDS